MLRQKRLPALRQRLAEQIVAAAPPLAVSFPYPPLPALNFAVPAVGVDSAAALERELRKSPAAVEPAIMEARVDSAHYSQTVFD